MVNVSLRPYLFFFLSAILISFNCLGSIRGVDVLTGKSISVNSGPLGTVVLFLSSRCPCSDSHVMLIKDLAREFKGLNFVAINSNVDEDVEMAKSYFVNVGFAFPVIKDLDHKIADSFKAEKTPHVFLLSAAGDILYKGGVTDSNKAEQSTRNFLKEALEDVQSGRNVRTPTGRALGCSISNGQGF